MMMAAAGADESSSASSAAAAPAAPLPADAAVGASSGIATPPAPPKGSEVDDDELPLTLDKALEEGANRAMRGDVGVLRQVLAPGVEWRGPLGNHVGLAKVEEELRGLGNLLSDPRMAVFASKDAATKLEWIGSGTWRLPWLPRFIVKGASTVETGADGKVREELQGLPRTTSALRAYERSVCHSTSEVCFFKMLLFFDGVVLFSQRSAGALVD